jgi:peptidoglycan hydrolase-like protein with peptidoglycan-binding domain
LILEGYGISSLPTTGFFEYKTNAAGLNLSTGDGLQQDGAVGSDTWNALLNIQVR